jgi:hypothetical protein
MRILTNLLEIVFKAIDNILTFTLGLLYLLGLIITVNVIFVFAPAFLIFNVFALLDSFVFGLYLFGTYTNFINLVFLLIFTFWTLFVNHFFLKRFFSFNQ